MSKAAIISLGSVSSEWQLKAMKKYFDVVKHIDIRQVEVHLDSKQARILVNGKPINDYDCVYVKGSFRYAPLSRSITNLLWDKTYLPIKPSAFTISHDKLLTQLVLQRNGVPMPTTYLAATPKAAKGILKNVNYPIIMKFPSGTHGKGVLIAESYASASSMLDALVALKQPFLIQEYVDTDGEDIRAIVVGNKVVAAMKRKSVGDDERANIHQGASAKPIILDEHTKNICVNAAKVLGMDICAVDILESVKGPLVIETNLSPGMQGITEVTGIDVADKIAEFLYAKTIDITEGKKHEVKKVIKEVVPDQDVVGNIDLRNDKILLPSFINKIANFKENEEVVFKVNKKNISVKKL